jgi:hypothetical protein
MADALVKAEGLMEERGIEPDYATINCWGSEVQRR